MPGPSPMALGPFAFEALGFGYTGVTSELDTSWANIEVAQTFNVDQWTGPKKRDRVIKGCLFPEEFGGMDSLAGIDAAAQNGLPLPLVSIGGNIFGLVTIQGVSEDHSSIRGDGLPRKLGYQIKLRQFRPTGGAGGLTSLVSMFA